MRKLVLSTFAAFAALAISSCSVPTSFGPGSAAPALIYTPGVTYPALNTVGTTYQFTTDDYEMLGTVTAEGESVNIFYIISEGDNGYSLLLEEAQKMGADDVINVRADVSTMNILGYNQVSTKMTGIAISYN